MNSEIIVNLGVYCALAGIVGAKVLMIAMDPTFRANPLEIFSLSTLQSAGIFYGGLIAALITAYVYMRRYKLPVFQTADLFAPGLALILVFGILVGLGGLFLRLNTIVFGEPRGPTAEAKASYVPLFAHLALVLMAGIYMPAALVVWFENVAKMLG